MQSKKTHLLVLLSMLVWLSAGATDYYTASTGATLNGNGSVSANWTTNANGVTGLGSATILPGDNLFVLSGALVTLNASTTVNDLTIAGASATTMAMGDAGLILTISGNLSGSCIRTGKKGFFLLSGINKNLSYTDMPGSAVMSTSFNSTTTGNGGIRITGTISLTGNSTVSTALELATSGKLFLNGKTLTAGVFGSNTSAYFIGGSNSCLVVSGTGVGNTSNIALDQSNIGVSNYLRKFQYSGTSSASAFVSVKNSIVVDSLQALTNSSTANLKVDGVNSTVTVKSNYSFSATVGAATPASGSSLIFESGSTVVFNNESSRPVQSGANVTINGATLKVSSFATTPVAGTLYTLITGGTITGTFSNLLLPVSYFGSLSYPTNTVALSVTAPPTYYDFNSAVPSNISSSGNLVLSGEHTKDGANALKWTAANGTVLTANNLGITSSQTGSFSASSAQFFVYSQNISNDTLVFRFYDNANVLRREGHMLLNYKGWRDYHRSYRYDYNFGGELPSFNLNKMEVIYKPENPSSTATIYLDAFTIVGDTKGRVPGPHMKLDVQHFQDGDASKWVYVEGVNATALLSYLQTVPTASPSTTQEQNDALTVKSFYTRTAPTVTTTNLIAAKGYVTSCNITRNADNSITGRGLLYLDNVDTLIKISNYCSYLASGAIRNGDADAQNMLLLFMEYLIDQGLAEGGRNSIQTNNYTPAQNFPVGFLHGISLFPAPLKADVIKMLKWSNEYNIIYHPGNPYLPVNVDFIYNKSRFLFELAALDTSVDNWVRDLKYISRYLSLSANFTQGNMDVIKPDGTIFHHQSHYMDYGAYTFDVYVDRVYSLKGTVFKITQEAYNNMAKAYKTQFLLTSQGKIYANASTGRKPFERFKMTAAKMAKLIEVGGDLTGTAYTPDLASFYNYIFDTLQYPVAKARADGYYHFNYGSLGVQRKNNWIATMKGFTDKLFGTEIYADANRYGRYNSYGALEVQYDGDSTASGYPAVGGNGWDWKMPPGTTTIHIPYTELQAQKDIASEYQQKAYAGALSLGNNGVFAMNFQEDANGRYAANNLKFYKSVFTFDSIFVCLGSGIGSSNGVNNTATNLFQAVSATANPSIYVNSNTPESSSTYNTILSTANNSAWVVNGQTTGYYVPLGGGDVTVSRGVQTTPVHSTKTGSPTSTSNFSNAFINHGTSPSNAKYQFVMVPGTTPSEMAALSSRFDAGEIFQVLSQTDTLHAVKYLPEKITSYAFFNAANNVNIGYVKSITGETLLGVKEINDTLVITINNPNLNTVSDAATDWKSSPYNVSLTLNGQFHVLDNAFNASIITNDSTLTAAFVLMDGFSATLKLLRDTTPPTIIGPANLVVHTDAGLATASGIQLGAPVVTDNHGVDSVVNNAPAIFPLGVTTVTWTAKDNFGNTSTAAQTVTVVDVEAPAISGLLNINVNTDSGAATASNIQLATPVVTDNVGVKSVSNNAPSMYHVGVTTITWTAVDSAGNIATALQTVTVTDVELPVVNAPSNAAVNTDAGAATASNVQLGLPVFSDNVGVQSVINNAPVLYPVGVTTVTWTVTDGSGNVTNATQTVTVSDAEAPVIQAPANITANTDPGSSTSTNIQLGQPMVTDNYSVRTISNNAPFVYPVGITTIVWTAIDNFGNSAMATQTVTVTDAEAPMLHVPANQYFCYSGTHNYQLPVADTADNCAAASISFVVTGATQRNGLGVDASGLFNVGLSTVTWTAIDVHGNSTTRQCTVNISSPLSVNIPNVYAINPSTDLANMIYIGYGPASLTLSAVVTGGEPAYSYTWLNGGQSQTQQVSAAGTYSVTVNDKRGCVANQSILIKTLDVQCGNNNNKVMICHNDRRICVAPESVQEHLNHGDHLGDCNAYTSNKTSEIVNTELKEINGIEIYPNPTTDNLFIIANNAGEDLSIHLFNSIGQKVRSVNLSNAISMVSLKDLPVGIYYVYVKDAKQTMIKKIIKE
jgi:hypothetical protein